MEDRLRLRELRKSLGLTQGEFGKRIGMSDVAISYMESGRTALSNQNLNLICLTFGVNREWLRHGEGEMMNEDALFNEKEKRLLAFFECLSPRAMDMAIEYVEKLVSDEVALHGGVIGRAKDFVSTHRVTVLGKEGGEEKIAFERKITDGTIGPWRIEKQDSPQEQ